MWITLFTTSDALAQWTYISQIGNNPPADVTVRQVTLAVDGGNPPSAYFLSDIYDACTDYPSCTTEQPLLMGVRYAGSFGTPGLVSDNLLTAAHHWYCPSPVVYDDNASDVFVTARFSNVTDSKRNLEEWTAPRDFSSVGGNDTTIAATNAADNSSNHNMLVLDQVTGKVGACWSENNGSDDDTFGKGADRVMSAGRGELQRHAVGRG